MVYEDYDTDYTEVDLPADRIQLTDHTDTHRCQRNETTYVYKDGGAGHFDDIDHDVTCESDFEDNYCYGGVWAIANALNDIKSLLDNGDNFLEVDIYRSDGVTGKNLNLRECTGVGVWQGDSGTYQLSVSTPVYLTIVRSGTTINCYIYSDSNRLTLEETLNLTVNTQAYQYIYASSSFNSGNAVRDGNFLIQNLDLNESAPAVNKKIPNYFNSDFNPCDS